MDAAVACDGERRRVRQRELGAERRGPRVPERSGAERVEEAARAPVRESEGPRSRRGSSCPRRGRRRAAAPRGSSRSRRSSSRSPRSASPRSMRSRTAAARARAGSRGAGREQREQRGERLPRVAHETERGPRGADPLGRRVDLDQATRGAEGVLPGRLGAELGADAQDDVGRLERAPRTRPRRRRSRPRADGFRGVRPSPCRSWPPERQVVRRARRSSSHAPERSTPPPAQITGLSAPPRTAAASASAS